MDWYKVYFLDEADKIASVETVECEDDAAAACRARAGLAERLNFPAFELWQGVRRIGKFRRGE